MQFTILNRWTGEVQVTAEISCDETASPRVKLGLAVRWARANDADLSGADLRDADLRGADLRDADLRDADLRGADLRGADLRGAVLRDADLRGADLRDADLRGADLRDADLSGADLRDADLRDAPVIPNIHRQVYEAASAPGALDMSDWHTCDTTHCRAGWVTTLAGEPGMALERRIGTPAAATLIYLASDPTIGRIPDFYCSNAEALEDMRIRAEAENARVGA